MADLQETVTYETGIYQLETTDPVVGGPPNLAQNEGFDNVPHQQLANRCAWLKQQVDILNSNAATQADIDAAIAALIDGAPGTLNTLNELAEALNDDANLYNTLSGMLIGVGQTWQDMTGSRAVDTIYENTTGRPISISLIGRANGGAARPFEVSVDQIAWVQVTSLKHLESDNERVSVLVPAGHFYRLVGASTINTWAELR